MVLSVVVSLRSMSISRLDGFRIMSRSRKLIHPLLWYVRLNYMYVCILVYVCIEEVRLYSVSVIYN